MAMSYFNKGDYDEAIFNFNEAIRLDAKNAESFYNRGNAYFAKGDYELAMADYHKAMAINPMLIEL
jgi:tetratricopeptide (TPR) repeat protein